MSATTRIPTGSEPRRRGPLLPTLVVASVVVLLFILFTNVWTDRLWFVSMDYGQVFTITFWTRVGLFVVVGLIMALAIVGNTALAYRLRPPTRPGPLASELLERYREALESRFVQIMIALGVVVALFAGVSGASQVGTFLAWVNRTPFGTEDPRFGFDISFYVFELPWWRWVLAMVTAMLIFSTLAAGIVHYVMGALRVAKGERRRTSAAAQTHLSVLIGLTVLCFAVSAWLDRYAYQTTTNSLLTGLGFTDDQARVPASLVVAIITAICALLFLSNVFVRRWIIPVAALVLAVVSSILLTLIYPAGVQAIEVNPNEPDKERPYIERHIAATRAAYGIDGVEITNYDAETEATAGQLRSDAQALPGIRLIDPAVVAPTFDQLQQVRGFYSFPQVLDVDRYQVEGQETDAVVAARELDISGLQDRSWNNVRTVYTHGYGLVAAYGNRRQPGGEPEWLVRDMPPVGALAEQEPRIYFGEQHTEYSIVGAPAGSAPIELDTPGGGDGGGERRTTYSGAGGVPIGNWINRLLYATRMADVNLLLSGRVNEESKIIYNRTPKERVRAAAPWLTVDSNAYPALVEGRIVWVVDGYTTSNDYPNSHRISLDQATSDTQTRGTATTQPDTRVNYMRNSVKAVVDAYDGRVTLYAWDETDPVLQTWRNAYPDTVQPRSEIAPALLEHLRYPDDLFKVQRDVLGRYHVTDPGAWYQQNDLWVIPNDPVAQNNQRQNPYLLSVKWPGDNIAHFSQTTVFVPRGRNNLAAFMAVNADAASPEYGRMRILRMSDTQQVDGPNQSFNAMVTDEQVANRLRPYLNQGSAQVVYGNLLTLPLGGGLLYAQPIYTQKAAGQGSYPALTFVTVRFGERVGIGDTLQQALDQVFGGDAGASTGEGDPETDAAQTPPAEAGAEPRPADSPAAVRALGDANTAFNDAQTALRDGDLGLYQEKIEEARSAMQRAQGALGG